MGEPEAEYEDFAALSASLELQNAAKKSIEDAKNALRRRSLKELISALDVDVANLSDDHRKSFTDACDKILKKIKTQLVTLELCQSTCDIFRKVTSFITDAQASVSATEPEAEYEDFAALSASLELQNAAKKSIEDAKNALRR